MWTMNLGDRRCGNGFTHSMGALALLLALAACDQLLDVDLPGEIDVTEIENPAHAELLVNSVIGDFECAFGTYTMASGLLLNMFHDAQLASSVWPIDQRTVHPSQAAYASAGCTGYGSYTPLSTARWQADNTLRLLQDWSAEEVPNRRNMIATSAAYAGYSLILLGEGMCSAAIDGGPELTRADLFEEALDRFATAISEAEQASDAQIGNMARIGMARALLNLGRGPEALTWAEAVPDGFVHYATFSGLDARRRNWVHWRNNVNQNISVHSMWRDLEWEGVPDPRVPVQNTGALGSDITTPLWVQEKYPSEGASIPIARWEEAQLIIAEVQGGQAAVDIINLLHDRAGLPPFQSTDETEIQEHVVQERGRELFLESHHAGDLHRYGLALDPAPGTEYPPKAGGLYGSVDCFPLPDTERLNNPNIGG